jgi:hypothetical protein
MYMKCFLNNPLLVDKNTEDLMDLYLNEVINYFTSPTVANQKR